MNLIWTGLVFVLISAVFFAYGLTDWDRHQKSVPVKALAIVVAIGLFSAGFYMIGGGVVGELS